MTYQIPVKIDNISNRTLHNDNSYKYIHHSAITILYDKLKVDRSIRHKGKCTNHNCLARRIFPNWLYLCIQHIW